MDRGTRSGGPRFPPALRRALRKVLPRLSQVYGLKWADIEVMPSGEIEAYLDDLHAMQKKR